MQHFFKKKSDNKTMSIESRLHLDKRSVWDDDDDDDSDIKSIADAMSESISISTHQEGSSKGSTLVRRSKLLVYMVILLSALVAGILTYFFMEKEESRWYEDEFGEFAEKISDSTETNLKKLDQASSALANLWTSKATQDNGNQAVHQATQVGPNVTIVNYGPNAKILRDLGQAKFVAILPYVSSKDKTGFEKYAVENQGWIDDDLMSDFHTDINKGYIPLTIYGGQEDADFYFPIWQISPTPTNASSSPIMMDMMPAPWFSKAWEILEKSNDHVFCPIAKLDFLTNYGTMSDIEHMGKDSINDQNSEGPLSILLSPIYSGFDENVDSIVGITASVIDWASLMSGLLDDEAEGIFFDLQYSCRGFPSSRHAFRATGDGIVVFAGEDYEFDKKHMKTAKTARVTFPRSYEKTENESDDHRLDGEDEAEVCAFFITTVISDEYIANWQDANSTMYAILVASIFLFTMFVFVLYDVFVERRNRHAELTAKKSAAIVTSLFPKNVAEQMLREENHVLEPTNTSMMSVSASNAVANNQQKKPIADLFSETTIMFADIAGFTAWSSMRDPAQVFVLLERIFNKYDTIAEKKGIFKVETVGDCYVAVCGLPVPRKDHAVRMASFARSCITEMNNITDQLEVQLGPDTGDLQMRIGLHSGPVTAGVLRGQRARFQLFGQTMNKASRIETSGKPGKCHLSEETADCLKAHKKGHWVIKRDDHVNLKGLGEAKTYWLVNKSEADTISMTSSDNCMLEINEDILKSSKHYVEDDCTRLRLVSWQSEMLATFLKKVIAFRAFHSKVGRKTDERELQAAEKGAIFGHANPDHCISFPMYTSVPDEADKDLHPTVKSQLEKFVTEICDAYNPNAFHNFTHASHVTMSVTRLLRHIESSSTLCIDDPLSQFVIVLVAVIHDVDHSGVSNDQLVKENHPLAKIYKTSSAERNSLDVTWSILNQDCFHELRRAMYCSVEDFERFQQLMVHSLLVTDIMDKGLQQERKQRWEELFGENAIAPKAPAVDPVAVLNKRKTALLEHIIQASDVAHTMQHWRVYQKWNAKLFQELKDAWKEGRLGKDPAEFWYEGEIGFFDFYVLPLARRLSVCPAFGASGEELLRFAQSNRDEWVEKGEQIVEAYKE